MQRSRLLIVNVRIGIGGALFRRGLRASRRHVGDADVGPIEAVPGQTADRVLQGGVAGKKSLDFAHVLGDGGDWDLSAPEMSLIRQLL